MIQEEFPFASEMIDVSDFRKRLLENEFDFLLDEVILSEGARHVSAGNIMRIAEVLSAKFGAGGAVRVLIVGSAKLGFSLAEKRRPEFKPRYRPFSPESDIDVAVVSEPIFESIWDELSSYSHRAPRFPWNSELLGDYLVCGWLRPDHFPGRLRRCDDWWDVFRALSADSRFGRRKVRGGLFHSMGHLRRYQMRALRDCHMAEETRT